MLTISPPSTVLLVPNVVHGTGSAFSQDKGWIVQSRQWLLWTVPVMAFWGHYGVAAKFSGDAYHHQPQLTFVLVCAAYSIGALVVAGWIKISGDHAVFTKKSKIWASVAGVCGAGGALAVVVAMRQGNPIFVMPLVFGPAQVFNALFTWRVQGYKERPKLGYWLSLLGLMLGAFSVVMFKGGASLEVFQKFEIGWWLLPTFIAASCWGLYGVSARMAVLSSKISPDAHPSHLKPLFVVCCVYAVFGVLTYLLGLFGVYEPITLEQLNEPTGATMGFVTGLMGFLGAACVIPANSVAGSPGPSKVMAWVFLGAAVVNATGSMFWDWLVKSKEPSVNVFFLGGLVLLAASGYLFARRVPPPAPKK